MPPEPLVLAFDTSAAHCAAAVLSGDRVLAARHDEMAKGQAERLFPLLEELLAEADATWQDLTLLAVGIGPGNFTGVRISVAAARGLALSLNLPAHGISSLEALSFGLPQPLVASVDARQGRVYLQQFGGANEPPRLEDLEDVSLGISQSGLAVVGHEAEVIAVALSARVVPQPMPMAVAMARIAQLRGLPKSPPAPLYLRAADAAPSRDLPPLILP